MCDATLRAELSLVQKAEACLAGGVRVLQLRMKNLTDREALAATLAVVRRCDARGAVCLVNDRVDLVVLSGAHGVHLGDEDVPCEAARRLLGPGAIIGVTVRDEAGIARAAEQGASYVGLGPLFPTSTKVVDHPPLGVAQLARLCARSPLPVVAIAGIDLSNIAQVAGAGAHGAAVASGWLSAPDPAKQAAALVAAFG